MRRYIEWILRHRWLVITGVALITTMLGLQAKNLKIIIDPNTVLPRSHPYVTTTTKVEELFGSKYVVVIGITPENGDIFQPQVLERVERITAALLETPGVVKENLLSLSARRAKNITGNSEGMEVRALMPAVPRTAQEMAALKDALIRNPAYTGSIVGRDFRTAAVIAEFRDGPGGFRGIVDRVTPIVDSERAAGVEIAVGGLPVFLARIEIFSERMVFLFPLAVLLVGLIHFEAFRTMQGLILPLVTALVAVIWGVGFMGAAGIPLDVFNSTTPILILAVAAGHAVQLLKRYYEEYHRIRDSAAITPREANTLAVVESLIRVGPVMLTAGMVAALGFFSLIVFDIVSVRTFGVFTGIGILSALVLEMTFIPALRSLLPAPSEKERHAERAHRFWDRITGGIAAGLTGRRRALVYLSVAALVAVSAVGATRVIVDSATKGFFSPEFQFKKDDTVLNARLGGTNTLYLLVEGNGDDAIKDPRVLKALEAAQHYLESQPHVGKTVSIADFVKRMNRAMNADDPAYDKIPDSRDLISQYLLLYSMSGEPGDFDSYVDYGYRNANLTAFLKTDSSAYVEELIAKLRDFAAREFPAGVKVSVGGSVPQGAALNAVMVESKLLNMAQIAAVVFLISSLVFRSFVAGLLVLVPLALAVIANFGIMGWTGMRLNIPNALSSAMAIGIGADYAIYLIYRLREELAAGADETAAVRNALATAGKASLFVASAVAGGYAVLLFSFGFYIHIWLAILIATAMLVSAMGALTVIPALILSFRPRFIFNGGSMKLHPAVATAAVVFAAGLAVLPPASQAAELSATEIMEKNFVVSKVLDSVSDATFTLANKAGQERVRKTFGTTKLQGNGIDNMRMTRFLSPPDVKGTVSLLIEHAASEDDIWIYLPALKKVRRLVASNKKDSFVGTDFSYGDIIGHKVEEWDHKLLREEQLDGQWCYVIESLPKTAAVKTNTGYSKRVGWIRKDNFVAVKGEFWDEAGKPLKTATFTDVRHVDPARNRWQPMVLRVGNLQTGHRTTIQLENFKVNQQVKDEFFTTRYMERPN
ncbi:MAG: outer membrane lipoprotein-sorting protein [Burkholderiales bacterium]